MSSREQLERDLQAVANPERAKSSSWFFKSGPGQYGEGDQFLGITVPMQRKIALRYRHLPLPDIEALLASPFHEFRFAAVEILVAQYENSEEPGRQHIVDFYLSHTARINNWDLVDTSAPYILGEHLKTRTRHILDKLAASPLLWERRIAIVATLALIKNGELNDTFRVARKLLSDRHDLIHKAVGWALREAGIRSRLKLIEFLRRNYSKLPRTTLRYAIEHFPLDERKRILAGNFRIFPGVDQLRLSSHGGILFTSSLSRPIPAHGLDLALPAFRGSRAAAGAVLASNRPPQALCGDRLCGNHS